MKGWRTIVFNVISVVILVANNAATVPYIPHQILETVIVVGNLILRFVTTTPVGQSTPSA